MRRTEAQKQRRRITEKARRDANRESVLAYHRKWREKHPGKDAEYSRNRRLRNPDATKAENKRWKSKNPECMKRASKKWNSKNRDKRNADERARCARDPAFVIGKRLRTRVRDAVRKHSASKSESTILLTGCDTHFLVGYLEARFLPGMKWSNYGSIWEIDHRIPCASFDLRDESHQRSCFHYSNLQPLFVGDNRRKHAKMPAPHQAELL